MEAIGIFTNNKKSQDKNNCFLWCLHVQSTHECNLPALLVCLPAQIHTHVYVPGVLCCVVMTTSACVIVSGPPLASDGDT